MRSLRNLLAILVATALLALGATAATADHADDRIIPPDPAWIESLAFEPETIDASIDTSEPFEVGFTLAVATSCDDFHFEAECTNWTFGIRNIEISSPSGRQVARGSFKFRSLGTAAGSVTFPANPEAGAWDVNLLGLSASGTSAGSTIYTNLVPAETNPGRIIANFPDTAEVQTQVVVFPGCDGCGIDDAGPLVTALTLGATGVVAGSPVDVTATVSDVDTGGGTIAGAQASLDGADWMGMDVMTGAYDAVTEDVGYTIPGASLTEPGDHELCVRAADVAGNTGPERCATLTVQGPTGSLRGVLTDGATGEPIPGALISVNPQTTTGPDGAYVLTGIPVGLVDVTISAAGYATRMVTVEIAEGAVASLDVTLALAGGDEPPAVDGTAVDDPITAGGATVGDGNDSAAAATPVRTSSGQLALTGPRETSLGLVIASALMAMGFALRVRGARDLGAR